MPLKSLAAEIQTSWTKKKRLGMGGDGTVTLYENPSNGKVVAFKQAHSTSQTRELLREGDLLRLLRPCPQIVEIFGDSRGSAWIKASLVLEFCEYGDALNYRDDMAHVHGYFPEQTLWKFFIDMSKAFDWMHNGQKDIRHPMIHMDFKPDNVLVARPKGHTGDDLPWLPEFKITDLTRAKLIHHTQGNKPAVRGTWEYQPHADECAEGGSPAVDIWGLGASIQSLALNMLPVVSSRRYKAMCHFLGEVPSFVDDDDDFWRQKKPGFFRPINLPPAEQIKEYGLTQRSTMFQYSDTLNKWYSKCMERWVHRRATAAKLVSQMVPIGERLIAELELDRQYYWIPDAWQIQKDMDRDEFFARRAAEQKARVRHIRRVREAERTRLAEEAVKSLAEKDAKSLAEEDAKSPEPTSASEDPAAKPPQEPTTGVESWDSTSVDLEADFSRMRARNL